MPATDPDSPAAIRLPARWRAGVELSANLNAEFLSQRATRPALEVERLLARCRRCGEFRANGCSLLDVTTNASTYVELLTRAEHVCRRWSGKGI